jgi:hypothetical protein
LAVAAGCSDVGWDLLQPSSDSAVISAELNKILASRG